MLSIPGGCRLPVRESSRDGRHAERHDKVTTRNVALRLYMMITEGVSRMTKKRNSLLRSIRPMRPDIGSPDQRFRSDSPSLQEKYRKLGHSFVLPHPFELQTCNGSRVGVIP